MKQNRFIQQKQLEKVGTATVLIKAGADACRKTIPFEQCPYEKGTVQANMWEHGWKLEEARRNISTTIQDEININDDLQKALCAVPEKIRKPKNPNRKNLEAAVLKECLDYLKKIGIFCWRNSTGSFNLGDRFIKFSMPGAADIIGLLSNGKFLAVECKRREGGKQTVDQKLFQHRIEHSNGIYLLVRSAAELDLRIKEKKL